MHAIVEYPICGAAALLLWLLPRPLGLAPRYQLLGVLGATGCCAWVLLRSRAALAALDEDALNESKRQQEVAELAGQQALLEAQRLRLYQEAEERSRRLEEEALRKIQERVAQLQEVANRLSEEKAQIAQERDALAAQPSPEEKGLAATEKRLFALEQAHRIQLKEIELEAQLAKYRQQLGAPNPQERQLALIQELVERLGGAAPRTINVTSRPSPAAAAPYDDWAEDPPLQSNRQIDGDPTEFVIG